MHELIKKLENPNVSMVMSDDGTMVFMEKRFELDTQTTPPTVVELPSEVIGTTTEAAVLEEIASLQTKSTALTVFLTDNIG